MKTLLIIVGVVVLVAGVFTLMPLGAIWAINTLFHCALPYTGRTWAAALLLICLMQSIRIKLRIW